MLAGFKKIKLNLKYVQIIALGYLSVILVGAVILCMPIASKSGEFTKFFDALFMAVSATCVTGFGLFDTFVYWSLFGQLTIIVLVQIGGIGILTLIAMLMVLLRRRIAIGQRQLLVHSMGLLKMSQVIKLVKRIVTFALFVELVVAAVLCVRFVPQMGFGRGVYFAIFHSVSAFCNAGFDLFGANGQYSLSGYSGDLTVLLAISVATIVGGIGMLVWDDVVTSKFRIKKYSLHSKIVLSTTVLLISTSWLLFSIFEWDVGFGDMSVGQKISSSFFQAIIPRSSGFGIIRPTELSPNGKLLTTVLMFVGGSPGSTAGGIKTTTLAILALNAIKQSRGIRSIAVFKRQLDINATKQASALLFMYLSAIVLSVVLILSVDSLPMSKVLFEVVSAIGTVGLSMGITTQLSALSRLVLILLMFIGRIGGLSLFFALAGKKADPPIKRLTEKIQIG